ncbi:hypothetical protein PHYBOEH_008285 [Phytophthora boehmeriae]|uniref:Necrosis inducing-like protein NPP1 type n=1 Tax=Phytophthora boehmeriae TaxID=109152 RepID=A0A8T1X035_9STRA|nr:hypothetical protein PHYBOEH_008285 [Phytophthora boehmeriae]
MNLRALVVAVFAAVATADAISIDHDKVEAFAELEPTTVSEKAAVRFKPRLRITDGCHPYPAVNAAGETSAGLDPASSGASGCRGIFEDSQVYGRSAWYSNVWAIMYAWYFPKDAPADLPGRRHEWENCIVWIDNPALENPKILGISVSGGNAKYYNSAPPDERGLSGDTPKIDYLMGGWPSGYHILELTSLRGGFQDLIMWEQLTEEARAALQTTKFDEAWVPMKDGNFTANLKQAWPF